MPENIRLAAQRIGNEIIDLSTVLDRKMEKWSDTATRPNNLDITECVGFISRKTDANSLNIVVDLQALSDDNQAVLRTWAIDTQPDNNSIERFNNIQLTFAINYDQARSVTQKGSKITRDDLRTLLNLDDTSLIHMVVSDQTGANEAAGEMLGQRYELDVNELNQSGNALGEIDATLHAVLFRLQESAKREP